MDINMGLELGEMDKVNNILESGEIIKLMVKVYILGKMEISMKEIG
jgi:hypothetical protein